MFALLAILANVAVAVVSAQQEPVVFNTSSLFSSTQIPSDCGISGPPSCSISSPPEDELCCYEYPGGLLLQTQFWDTHPSTGPDDSWTIHGFCDGSFESDCDPGRSYKNIAELLKAQGAGDTLSYMDEYWVDMHGNNEQFWQHEWSKHGTCYSTLQPSCLPSESPRGAEAVAFFQQVWLASQGITPHRTRTHTLSELTRALKTASGYTPAISCSGNQIKEIQWYFYVRGSLLDGEFEPIDTPIKSKCPSGGLRYIPKSG
ncbi:ribonuclease T2-like protein [Russula brevipes]|nr:ribonuclease T2-like protein [Russula brevipes]